MQENQRCEQPALVSIDDLRDHESKAQILEPTLSICLVLFTRYGQVALQLGSLCQILRLNTLRISVALARVERDHWGARAELYKSANEPRRRGNGIGPPYQISTPVNQLVCVMHQYGRDRREDDKHTKVPPSPLFFSETSFPRSAVPLKLRLFICPSQSLVVFIPTLWG